MCGHKEKPGSQTPKPSKAPPSGLIDPRDYPNGFDGLSKRGLTKATLRRYGYFVGRFKGEAVHVAPYFDTDGQLTAQKVRLPNKDFLVLKASASTPGMGECQLFGRHVFGDKHDRQVVITEGEIDAMSVAQAVDFKFPCVSVASGAKGAAKSIKSNYLWLDRFAEIVLWFDDDEPGQAAVADCAPLFQVGKVKVVRMIK